MISSPRRKAIKVFLLITSFFGLASFNVATLISDQIHTAGYNMLASILRSTLPDAALEKLLRNSSTVQRKIDSLQIQELAAKNADLERKLIKRAEVAKNVSKRVAARSVRAATRNISSIPGKAIPLLSIALEAGTTVLDINDLCDTINDMNELSASIDGEREDGQKICGIQVPGAK